MRTAKSRLSSSVWYVGCHGGKSKGSVNNILVYSDKGKQCTDALLASDPSHPLEELRGFGFVGELLYVVNGSKDRSELLVFKSDGHGGYAFQGVYASGHDANAVVHPYDFTFDSSQRCYISNQDTNVVAGFKAAKTPLDVAPFLVAKYPHPERFLAGTAVASAVGALPGLAQPPPSDVPTPEGLQVCIMAEEGPKTGPKVVKSVRGVLWFQGSLFVADEPGNAVKIYDGTGKIQGRIEGDNLREPVQLLLHGSTLYIGSSGTGSVVTYDLTQGAPVGKAQPKPFVDGVKSVSGMDFGSDGLFYAAARTDKEIKRFPAAGGSPGEDFPLDPGLSDDPEFILHVPG